MKQTLFLNGVYEVVLKEILEAQKGHPDRTCFLQPYSSGRIVLLDEAKPSVEDPVTVYISTTTILSSVQYTAKIVGWECKQEMSEERIVAVSNLIAEYQPEEGRIYFESPKGKPMINLISVQGMEKLQSPFSVSLLRKLDGTALKPRTMPGGWAYVTPLQSVAEPSMAIPREDLDREFETAIARSMTEDREKRLKRLSHAPVLPEKVQTVSQSFRRNPDVVVEVLSRAKGICESCGKPAPFLRARDGRPFLEIHHVVTLANGGTDTVENAIALCPNCHRKKHHGVPDAD